MFQHTQQNVGCSIFGSMDCQFKREFMYSQFEKILNRREVRDLGVPTGCLGDNCRFLRHSGPELASSGPPDVVRVYQSTSNRNGTSCYVPSIFKGFFYWDVAY